MSDAYKASCDGNGDALVRVRDLKAYFPVRGGVLSRVVDQLKAVDGVSFDVRRGQTLGLVGESGCGKTTTGRTILRLLPATDGSVQFDGVDLLAVGARRLREMRRRMQIVFQDPVGSLNPRMSVGAIVGEPLRVHRVARGKELAERVWELLERVGLRAADAARFPHEFSGGQRQRVGIARAIALNPKFIVCDEPVSALDVSIQSQIINLLADLREEIGLSYLFIAHDLAIVRHFCDSVAVMYLGKIVESAPVDELFANPRHPYTQALLYAAPDPDPTRRKKRRKLSGEPPSAVNPPSGCAFHPRCPFAVDECLRTTPELTRVGGEDGGHLAACHLAGDDLSWERVARDGER